MRISDWSSDVCSSDLELIQQGERIATNGDVRLSATPGQWDAIGRLVDRKIDAATGTVTATLEYPDYHFRYVIRTVPRGEQIGLTQPAMSAALGRLRLMFDDPLLIRVGRGLELTRKAEALALPLREALAAVEHTLAQNRGRSEEHTSELQSLMRISYAVFCLKKKKNKTTRSAYEKHRC